jgi:hypothetical protein
MWLDPAQDHEGPDPFVLFAGTAIIVAIVGALLAVRGC